MALYEAPIGRLTANEWVSLIQETNSNQRKREPARQPEPAPTKVKIIMPGETK